MCTLAGQGGFSRLIADFPGVRASAAASDHLEYRLLTWYATFGPVLKRAGWSRRIDAS